MNTTDFKRLTSFIEMQSKRVARYTNSDIDAVRTQARYESKVLKDILDFAKRIEKESNQ